MDAADDVPGLLSCFGKVKKREVVGSDQTVFDQQWPVDEAFPKRSHENNRNVVSFASLKKGQRLKQFVECAESSREEDD